MRELYDAISDVQKDIAKAKENRRKIRKRVYMGVSHESHLEYADGLVAGLESALASMTARRLDRIPEGEPEPHPYDSHSPRQY
jgi:hypothetical protein